MSLDVAVSSTDLFEDRRNTGDSLSSKYGDDPSPVFSTGTQGSLPYCTNEIGASGYTKSMMAGTVP